MRSPPRRRSRRSTLGTRTRLRRPRTMFWRHTRSARTRRLGGPSCSRRSPERGGYAASVPELPEVETVRARLEPVLTGRRFVRVEIADPRVTRPFEPRAVAAELAGETVAAVERRGKYLIVRFESGRSLLIHLRMTGSLRHATAGTLADDPYRRVVVRLDDGSDVAYRDVRRFGDRKSVV